MFAPIPPHPAMLVVLIRPNIIPRVGPVVIIVIVIKDFNSPGSLHLFCGVSGLLCWLLILNIVRGTLLAFLASIQSFPPWPPHSLTLCLAPSYFYSVVFNLSHSEFYLVAFTRLQCVAEGTSINDTSNRGRLYEIDSFWPSNQFNPKAKHNHSVVVDIVHFKFFVTF
jgi:hypothetical protein